MINVLKIQCPHCFEVYELFLSTKACVVVLNCPNCWTPILHNAKGVHVLSEQVMKRIKSEQHRSDLLEMLDKMDVPPRQLEVPVQSTGQAIHMEAGAQVPPRSRGSDLRRDAITRDDVIDLRIELATCQDSRQFIERL